MRHGTLKLGELVAATAAATALPLVVTPSAPCGPPQATGDVVGVGAGLYRARSISSPTAGDAYGRCRRLQPARQQAEGGRLRLHRRCQNARLAVRGRQGPGQPGHLYPPGTGSAVGHGTAGLGYHQHRGPVRVEPDRSCCPRAEHGAGAAAQRFGTAGFNDLVQDIVAGDNTPASGGDQLRAGGVLGSARPPASLQAGVVIDQIEVASDTLPILMTQGLPPATRLPLSATQLSLDLRGQYRVVPDVEQPRTSAVWSSTSATTDQRVDDRDRAEPGAAERPGHGGRRGLGSERPGHPLR